MLSKISQSEKDNYHKISLICRILEMTPRSIEEGRKKNQTKSERETKHKRLLIVGNKLRVAGGEGSGGMGQLGDGHWGGYVLY